MFRECMHFAKSRIIHAKTLGRIIAAILTLGILSNVDSSWATDSPDVPTPQQLELLQQIVDATAATLHGD